MLAMLRLCGSPRLLVYLFQLPPSYVARSRLKRFGVVASCHQRLSCEQLLQSRPALSNQDSNG